MNLVNESPLISVIVPFLNGSDWLIEALESVVSQTYLNWEIIVLDDGSEEKHSAVAKDYCSRHVERIIYTEHPGHVNKGVTISRNSAIELSNGTLIAFLDADDYWLPDKLAYELTLFKQYPTAEMICEASQFWYSWNDPLADDSTILVGVSPDKLYHPPELMKSLYPLGEGQPPCPSGIIIKREALLRSKGFEPVFSGVYQLYEDQAFLSKIYLKEIIFISGKANNRYRKRTDSVSSAVNDKTCYDLVRKFYLGWLESYLDQEHISDNEIAALIHSARKNMGI
jgi:glycosyltransferase involved in cell wall biosynthesis